MRFWQRHERARRFDDNTIVGAVDPTIRHVDGSGQMCRLVPTATFVVNYQVGHAGGRTLHVALTCPPHSGASATRPRRSTIQIPTEVLHHGWATLFPVERMAVIGGRDTDRSTILGPVFDVTSDGPETSRVHVHADRNRLRAALIALERAGSHLAGWIHSHPGCGPGATEPSSVDRAQHRDWVRDYSPALVSLIVVADGVVRVWGTAVEASVVQIELTGKGITPVKGHGHVYQLAR